ncbi:hypothetical protein PYCC9005_005161 [Savitreella phatthalungensis]
MAGTPPIDVPRSSSMANYNTPQGSLTSWSEYPFPGAGSRTLDQQGSPSNSSNASHDDLAGRFAAANDVHTHAHAGFMDASAQQDGRGQPPQLDLSKLYARLHNVEVSRMADDLAMMM